MTEKRTDSRKAPAKKSTWEPVKIIIHKETKIAARVSRLPIKPHPAYTYDLGYVNDDEQFKRFLRPKIEIKDGEVNLTSIDTAAVSWVMEHAEIYILEQIQSREDEIRLQERSRAPRKTVTVAPKHPSS